VPPGGGGAVCRICPETGADAATNRHRAKPAIATVARVGRMQHIEEVDAGTTLSVPVVCLNTNQEAMDVGLPEKLRVFEQRTGLCMVDGSFPIIQKAAREGGLKLMKRWLV